MPDTNIRCVVKAIHVRTKNSVPGLADAGFNNRTADHKTESPSQAPGCFSRSVYDRLILNESDFTISEATNRGRFFVFNTTDLHAMYQLQTDSDQNVRFSNSKITKTNYTVSVLYCG